MIDAAASQFVRQNLLIHPSAATRGDKRLARLRFLGAEDAATHATAFGGVEQLQHDTIMRLREESRPAPEDLQWMINPREDVEATLRDAAEEIAETGGVEVETFAREGDPADAILDVAEERGADLIVVGNKGMTGAKRFLLGSVPNKVSHHAPCSVLIIRTT